jgi:VanZ family protein
MHKLLSWMAVILWMSLIFYLSHQPAAESSELSSSVTEVIINTIETVAPKVKIEKGDLHHIVKEECSFLVLFSTWYTSSKCFEDKWGTWLQRYIIGFIDLHFVCYIR